ncbi:peptide chain release factor N(5)-glutamine methyltransferase [uncultured Eudoraea sp.]|uniref:peptide chain release factor N(5)-glutamine methyltransferase n=1 Tax=uncultured Eudoraea sp. TaxID=1035614 RepID=UPI00260B350F|nr:peptide chain release factor N(5)-glutamine methyltransferase [uncultured Eudoraea sp.]
MLLKEIKEIYHRELDEIYPKEEVDSMFYLMIEHFLGLERFILAIDPEIVITKDEEQYMFEGLSKLKKEQPIQYVLGQTTFLDLKILVNESVLIPRPETEELVNWALEDINDMDDDLEIIDIGTGSGCIAISLAKLKPYLKVTAIDISGPALEVAKKNALLNEVNIQFREVDILKAGSLGKNYDIIISNPPYIREMERYKMRNNVLQNEPNSALFVPDNDPLLFYRTIAKLARDGLNENGALYLEINQYLSEDVKMLLKEFSFSEIELRKDIFGNDRMIRARLASIN